MTRDSDTRAERRDATQARAERPGSAGRRHRPEPVAAIPKDEPDVLLPCAVRLAYELRERTRFPSGQPRMSEKLAVEIAQAALATANPTPTPAGDIEGLVERAISETAEKAACLAEIYKRPDIAEQIRELGRREVAALRSPAPVQGDRAELIEAAVNQNAAMRAELAHIGNLVSDLARAMKVDQANDDGTWPNLAGRIEKLRRAALALTADAALIASLQERVDAADRIVSALSNTTIPPGCALWDALCAYADLPVAKEQG